VARNVECAVPDTTQHPREVEYSAVDSLHDELKVRLASSHRHVHMTTAAATRSVHAIAPRKAPRAPLKAR